MVTVRASRSVAAPADEVFRTLTEVHAFPEVIPDVVRVEVLREAGPDGPLRFRETRGMRGREMDMELELVQCEAPANGEPGRARFVCEAHGTVWDSRFAVRPVDGSAAEVTIEMSATTKSLPKRFMNRLFAPLFRKGLVMHLDAIEGHCAP